MRSFLAKIFKVSGYNSNSNKTQISGYGVVNNVDKISIYGVKSKEPKETPVVTVEIDNNSNNKVIIGAFDTFNLELNEGEIVVYSRDGKYINIKNDKIFIEGDTTFNSNLVVNGNLEIKKDLTVDGSLAVNGDISSDGDISAKGNVSDSVGSIADFRTSFNSHTHTGNLGTPTSPPSVPV